jgi:hypothetical protein
MTPTLAVGTLGTEAVVIGVIATGIAAARDPVFTQRIERQLEPRSRISSPTASDHQPNIARTIRRYAPRRGCAEMLAYPDGQRKLPKIVPSYENLKLTMYGSD